MKTAAPEQVDVTVGNHGSIFLFTPHTETAKEWIKENCQEPMTFGDAIVVEHRYAHDLTQGMLGDGLIVK